MPDSGHLADIHFSAVSCGLAESIWTAARALTGDPRRFMDLPLLDRARRVERAAWLLRKECQEVSDESHRQAV